MVEGDPCYASIRDVPATLDGVVIVTAPEAALGVAEDSAAMQVPRVWIHRGMGPGSTSPEAVAYCEEHGVSVIPGGCPNMFGATSDPGHRCMRALLMLGRKIPRTVAEPRAAENVPQYGL